MKKSFVRNFFVVYYFLLFHTLVLFSIAKEESAADYSDAIKRKDGEAIIGSKDEEEGIEENRKKRRSREKDNAVAKGEETPENRKKPARRSKNKENKVENNAKLTTKNDNEQQEIDNCQSYIHRHRKDRFLERLFLPVEHYRYNHRDPEMAYRMAIMSSIAYWEFHKRELPENCTGFKLQRERVSRRKEFLKGLKYKVCGKLTDSHTIHKLSDTLAHGNFPISSFSDLGYKNTINNNTLLTGRTCREKYDTPNNRFTLNFWFYNWVEPGLAGVTFHDTDVLLSTSDDSKELVVAFGGTASAADAVTNLQTFERANHSSFFADGRNRSNIEGSLHRGFLNAYSRVDRGSVLRLFNASNSTDGSPLLESIYQRFGHCQAVTKVKGKKEKKKANNTVAMEETDEVLIIDDDIDSSDDLANDENTEKESIAKNIKERRNGGCKVKHVKLVDILREAVINVLKSGRTVHLTGHSLGGSLATLMAIDIIVNYPHVPVGRLHLWTFGAPQVADDLFLNSAIQAAARLKYFVKKGGNGRFHRFVTLSDACKVDVVSEVAKNTLASHKQNLHGHSARKLGGVHGHVVHFAEPHYLLTPDQYNKNETSNETSKKKAATTTHSTVAAHALTNYLRGISRESKYHPLKTDMPQKLSQWLME